MTSNFVLLMDNLQVETSLESTLPKKCLYSEFFWCVFSRIWPEYGDLQSKSPYSVQMRENCDFGNPKFGTWTLLLQCYFRDNLELMEIHFEELIKITNNDLSLT